jgi:hypothetical protein
MTSSDFDLHTTAGNLVQSIFCPTTPNEEYHVTNKIEIDEKREGKDSETSDTNNDQTTKKGFNHPT